MPEPVFLTRLLLHAFRNHRHTELAPGAVPLVVLTGPNGAGKTNVLEAVSLLAPGRGLRGAMAAAMVAHGADGFRVRAELLPDRGLPPAQFEMAADATNRRRLLVNGAPQPQTALSEWLNVLWLTPAMDRLFSDSPGARRRFLDRLTLALHPRHAGHAGRYEKAMRARSRLLTEGQADPLWLSALEQEMEVHGTALDTARRATVAALDALMADLPDTGFPRAALALEGRGAEGLAGRLARVRRRDAVARRATVGPHRADFLVTYREKAVPAGLASTGEQKALLVGILLAHAELVGRQAGKMPLLLLDEALAHLDPGRRRALFARLAGLGGQVWMTGTEERLFEGSGIEGMAAARFRLEKGAVFA